jgi:DNA processing protein
MSEAKPRQRLSDEQRFDWLRLIRSENVGPRTFRALINQFAGARAALEALPELARKGGARRPLRIAGADEVEREMNAARRAGVRYIALGEAEYPPLLRQIDTAPPILCVRGREEALQQPAVAIVGSRNASAAGLAFADRLARGLGESGYVVVSGLARGIDMRAHQSSLATGAVGVLAGGHAKPYPPEALGLIPRIVEFGAVVSEMPLDWEPRGRDFPRRNRIVSGLSLGVIVVEAARGSGSLITARFALDQSREVMAAPGSPLDPRAEGTNDLLREGAKICARVEDAVSLFDELRDQRTYEDLSETREPAEEPLWSEQALFGVDPDKTPKALIGDQFDEPGGEDYEVKDGSIVARIADLMGPSPISLDELARMAELDVGKVRIALIELDLAGRIEHSGGDRVALLSAEEPN